MACIIKTVSLNEEENQFLKDYKLSPTQLLKEQIWKMKGMLKNIAGERVAKQGAVIEFQNEQIERYQKLLEEHGILE